MGLPEVAAWTGVTNSDDDQLIKSLIKGAREYVEIRCKRALMPQTWMLRFDCFSSHEIRIPRPPLTSITSVKYYDTADVLTTLSASLYQVDTDSEPGRLVPVLGQSWPSTYARLNAVEIEYIAGYADANSVPDTLKEVILMKVDHKYEHRGAITELRLAEPPITVDDMLFPYVVF